MAIKVWRGNQNWAPVSHFESQWSLPTLFGGALGTEALFRNINGMCVSQKAEQGKTMATETTAGRGILCVLPLFHLCPPIFSFSFSVFHLLDRS